MTQVKMYLPKTADNYAEALTRIKRVFAEEYGGFTAYGEGGNQPKADGQPVADGEAVREGADSVVGGWVDDDGQLIEEPVVVIESATASNSATYTLRQLSKELLELTGESAIMAMHDNQKLMTTQ